MENYTQKLLSLLGKDNNYLANLNLDASTENVKEQFYEIIKEPSSLDHYHEFLFNDDLLGYINWDYISEQISEYFNQDIGYPNDF